MERIDMALMTYPYSLPPLPYSFEALEPYIDSETMYYHHDKHFQTYINNLNKALKPFPYLQNMTLQQLLCNPSSIPLSCQQQIIRNGGGVYNHNQFFNGLAPADQELHQPNGVFLKQVTNTFGSFDRLKKIFSENALSVFGSGWTALIHNKNGQLKIVNLCNQQTTLDFGSSPLILLDVWEHAYYLKYKNDRKQYIENAWNVLVMPN